MAGMPGIIIKVAADTRSAIQGLGKVDKALGKTATATKKFGAGFTAAAAGAGAAGAVFATQLAGQVVDAAGKALGAAVALGEALNKVQVIFGSASRTIVAFSKTTATSMGIAQTQALDAASSFATLGKAAGLEGGKLAGFSMDLVKLASDIGSFHNADVSEVIDAISSGLRGEAEPMRKFGVLLDDATLKVKAFDMGLYNGVGTLSQSAKVLAAYQVILEQTTDAQGDFERTSDSLANQQKVLKATLNDAATTMGGGFLTAAENVATAINGTGGTTDAITGLSKEMAALIATGGQVTGVLAGLAGAEDEASDSGERQIGILQRVVSFGGLAGYAVSRLMENELDAAEAVDINNAALERQEIAALDAAAALHGAADAAAALAGASDVPATVMATWNETYANARGYANALSAQKKFAARYAANLAAGMTSEKAAKWARTHKTPDKWIEAQAAKAAAIAKAKADAARAKAKAKADAKRKADAQEKADELMGPAYEPWSPPRYNRSRAMALRRADGRAAQKDARTGSRP